MNNTVKAITAIAALVLSGAAFAGPIYEYDRSGGTFGDNNDSYEYGFNSISASYDSDSADFTFAVDYSSDIAAGGWLVVSDGPNPKGVRDQLAILYFDRESQDVWAYAYDGQNNSQSWQTQPLLEYFNGAYTTNGSTSTIAINAANVNAMLTEGVQFGPEIGIWFHPAFGLDAFLSDDGITLANFSPRRTAWYDSRNENTTTTSVPAPGTLALLGLGLIGFGVRRKR